MQVIQRSAKYTGLKLNLFLPICLFAMFTIAGPIHADNKSLVFKERFQDIFKGTKRDGSSFKMKTSKLPIAMGTNYGTQGAELALVAGFSQRFSVSIAANFKDADRVSANTAEVSGNFQTKQKMSGVDTDLRFHPWENGVFASLGFRYNQNSLSKSLSISGNETFLLYGQSYGRQSITRFDIERKYMKFAPRIMVGFDNSVHTNKRYGFHLAAGYVYQGKGQNFVNVEYANNLNPLTNANLPEKIAKAGQLGFGGSWDKSMVPVISAGLKIRF